MGVYSAVDTTGNGQYTRAAVGRVVFPHIAADS